MKNFTKTQKAILLIVTILCVAVIAFMLLPATSFSSVLDSFGGFGLLVYLFGIFVITLCLAVPLILLFLFVVHNKNKQLQDKTPAYSLDAVVDEEIKN